MSINIDFERQETEKSSINVKVHDMESEKYMLTDWSSLMQLECGTCDHTLCSAYLHEPCRHQAHPCKRFSWSRFLPPWPAHLHHFVLSKTYTRHWSAQSLTIYIISFVWILYSTDYNCLAGMILPCRLMLLQRKNTRICHQYTTSETKCQRQF